MNVEQLLTKSLGTNSCPIKGRLKNALETRIQNPKNASSGGSYFPDGQGYPYPKPVSAGVIGVSDTAGKKLSQIGGES